MNAIDSWHQLLTSKQAGVGRASSGLNGTFWQTSKFVQGRTLCNWGNGAVCMSGELGGGEIT